MEQFFEIATAGADTKACFSDSFILEMSRQLTPALRRKFRLWHVSKKLALTVFATLEYQKLRDSKNMYLPLWYRLYDDEGILWVQICTDGRFLDCQNAEGVQFTLCENLPANVQYVHNRLRGVGDIIDTVPACDEPRGSVGQMFLYELSRQIGEELKKLLFLDFDLQTAKFILYGDEIYQRGGRCYTKLRLIISELQFFDFWIQWYSVCSSEIVDVMDILNRGSTKFEICQTVPADVLLMARESSDVDKSWIRSARDLFLQCGAHAISF